MFSELCFGWSKSNLSISSLKLKSLSDKRLRFD